MLEDKKQIYQTILSKETLIPVSALIVIVAVVMWATTIANDVGALKAQYVADIDDLESIIAAQDQRIIQLESQNVGIVDRMARIETKLDIVIDAINQP